MRNVLALLVSLLACAGCTQGVPRIWNCDFHAESGVAVLDTDRVRLVFEGVPIESPAGGSGGGAAGSLQVGGSGTSNIELTALNQKVTNHYRDGINTISLGNYTLALKDDGHVLVAGGKNLTLGDIKRTVVVHADGSADFQEP